MNNIIVAQTAGFCFGVNRAVEKIYKLINENDNTFLTPYLYPNKLFYKSENNTHHTLHYYNADKVKIGDIIIHDNFCQVVVTSGICDFLTINLNKVSRNKVIVKKISRDDIIPNSPNYKDISFTVSTQRLDCIISGLYNISRQDSLKYINGERVHVNYEKITSPSKEVEDNSLISVRGKGRSIIVNVGEITKKGRIKVQAKLIV